MVERTFLPMATILALHPWASEGFFQGRGGGFFQNFSRGGPKVVKFVFSQSKLRKHPFFAKNFKIQGALALPF